MTNTTKPSACKVDRYMPVHSARLLGAAVDPAKRDEARRSIKRLYAWTTTRGERERKTDKPHLIALIRLGELERLLHRRHHGFILPDDDDGRDSLEIVAHHVAGLRGEVESHIIAWAARWCPWLPQSEAAALARRIAAHPEKYTAARLAWRMGLTEIDRTELKITTIRPITATSDADIAARRRQRDGEDQKRRRAIKRAARPEPISHTKPWETTGISRRTWYRRRQKAGGTKPVGSRGELIAADEISATRSVGPCGLAAGVEAISGIDAAAHGSDAGCGDAGSSRTNLARNLSINDGAVHMTTRNIKTSRPPWSGLDRLMPDLSTRPHRNGG